MMFKEKLEAFVNNAMQEDIGDGDHTSLSCIPENQTGKAKLVIKENGVIAGIEVAEFIFKKVNPDMFFHAIIKDGEEIKVGDIAFFIEGKILDILKIERLVLNIMQRMSGVATQTREYMNKITGLHTKVLDTRKTCPGVRFLEKEAVKIGGGMNHRYGLFDMILLKDNHIDFAGGTKNAIQKAQKYLEANGKNLKIEIETRTLKDVEEVIEYGGVDRVMFDNFSVENTCKAVKMINRKYETEASGNITLDTIRSYAECGVDYISVGALTHQIKSLDLSLKAVK
jgi:nicotinate-nucleotide pyrophosphorylase (carboxylating)